MFVSSIVLKNALENYSKSKRREKYSSGDSTGSTTGSKTSSVVLVAFAILFLLMELVIVYYSIVIAFSCSQKGPERVVNVILAVLFPVPYLMLNLLFNNCAKSTLQTSSFRKSPTPPLSFSM